jgi:hypothetical protein
MNDRDRQRQLDGFVERFLTALEEGDFDTVDQLWLVAASDPDLEVALTEAARELAAEYDHEFSESAGGILESTVRTSMPTADVIRPSNGPLSVSEVAEHIRRNGSPGLSAVDLIVNDTLARIQEPVPELLGLSAVISWGGRYGDAPVSYWKAFRQAALSLRLRRESDAEYRLAARPGRPKKSGGDK